MTQVILFLALGLATGAVYSVLAVSLASVHTAAGLINFSQGSIALWAVWVAAELRNRGVLVFPVGAVRIADGPVGAPLAVALAVLCGTAWAALAHLLVFRPLRSAPMLSKVVASVGLMLLIHSLVLLRFDTMSAIAAPILTRSTITVGGAVVNVSDLILAAIALAVAAGLWGYFRFTQLGTATRAAAEDERAARLLGYSPSRLAGAIWLLSGAAASLVAVLASPSIGLDATSYMYYVIPALAAALMARLTSIPVACVAGLLLGCFQSLLLLMATKSFWPPWAQAGFGDAVPFVVVVVALFAFGNRIPARGDSGTVKMPDVRVPELRPVPTLLVVAASVGLVLVTSGIWRFAIVTTAIMSLIALSLVLLTGYLGQTSLAAMAFAGVGGFALSKLTISAGVPFPLSVLAAALVAAVFGVALGLPALRIRGAQLAVVTLAGALALQNFVFANPSFTPFEGNLIADPELFGWSLAVRDGTNIATLRFALATLVIVALVTVATMRVLAGRTGRAFLAVRANERAAASAGVNVAGVKLWGFALSAFIAGVGGCLIGYSRSQLSVGSFSVTVGLALLCMAYVGGITHIGGALVAGAIAPLGLLYTFLHTTLDVGEYYSLIAAAGLLVTAVVNPLGLAGSAQHATDSLRERLGKGTDPAGEVALA